MRVAFGSITATILLVFALFLLRRDRFGRLATGAVMLAALFSIGASEWVREDLRKPFVIGSYMYVNGIRVEDQHASLLARAQFSRVRACNPATATLDAEAEAGKEVFRLSCSQCHTADGYPAVRLLVRGRSAASMEVMLDQLMTWRHRRCSDLRGEVCDVPRSVRGVADTLARRRKERDGAV